MDTYKEQSEPLHPLSISDNLSDVDLDSRSFDRSDKHGKLPVSLLFLFAMLLLTNNGIWLLTYRRHVSSTNLFHEPAVESIGSNDYRFSSMTRWQAYHWNTTFASQNMTESDESWIDMYPKEGGLVSVPRTWAAAQQLPFTTNVDNPEEDSNGTYLVAAVHQMHCLTVIRYMLISFVEGEEFSKQPATLPWPHVNHCIDTIRQSLMCNVDSTLLYSENSAVYGDGQFRQCRDWDALIDWAEHHRPAAPRLSSSQE